MMTKPPEPRPGWKEPEFPDEAGYPDGVGTLDEGTATPTNLVDTTEEPEAEEPIESELEEFLDGDSRDE